MNAFFWSRRKKSSKEIILTIDELINHLAPSDLIAQTLSALSIQDVLEYRRMECNNSTARYESDEPGDSENDGNSDEVLRATMDQDRHPHETSNAVENTIPEELERCWFQLRSIFHGWDESQSDRERRMNRVTQLILRQRIMEKTLLPAVMSKLTFETRKCIGNVFRAMTVHNLQGFTQFLENQPEIMIWLTEGYKSSDTALTCGSMLRDCFEYECLAVHFLRDLKSEFAYLFQVVQTNSNFEVASDAFMNITRLLMAHKKATVDCLDHDFDRIFGLLNGLLDTSNYVTKRQALQLLSELLLDPVNFVVMQRYISARNNLRLVMLLLREPSDALRMDAFHVFKIFVANPHKSNEVKQLLMRNRDKLLSYVKEFGKNETNRDFLQERSLLIFTLQRMNEPLTQDVSPPNSGPISSLTSSGSSSVSSSSSDIGTALPPMSKAEV